MDVIVVNEQNVSMTTGIGTNATFVGHKAPTTGAGLRNGSILILNDYTGDGNYFDLGNHSQSCTDDFELCANGFTMMLWFNLSRHSDRWPSIFNSSRYQCTAFTGSSTEFFLVCGIYDPKQQKIAYFRKDALTYDWHLFTLTYSDGNGVRVYVDGCPTKLNRVKDRIITGAKNLQLGCSYNGHCAHIQYDDLFIWHEEKSSRFIWQFFHDYKST